MKKEGKLLTKAQKQEKAKIEARLESMRKQGFNVPDAGKQVADEEEKPKKRVVYGKKKKSKNSAQSTEEQPITPAKEDIDDTEQLQVQTTEHMVETGKK